MQPSRSRRAALTQLHAVAQALSPPSPAPLFAVHNYPTVQQLRRRAALTLLHAALAQLHALTTLTPPLRHT